MWEFVLGIAQAVLSDLIKEMILGKTSAVGRGSIEKDVADRLLLVAREQHWRDLEEMRRMILAEVDVISARDPNLQVAHDGIRLKNSPRSSIFRWSSEEHRSTEIKKHLEQLSETVARRRAELAPSSVEEFPISPGQARADPSPHTTLIEFRGWLEPPPTVQPRRWTREFQDLQDRISERRRPRRSKDAD